MEEEEKRRKAHGTHSRAPSGASTAARIAAKRLLGFRANDKKLSVMTRARNSRSLALARKNDARLESRACTNTGAFTRRVISIRGAVNARARRRDL